MSDLTADLYSPPQTLFIAGASGDTGRAVLRLAESRVPTIRALTRSETKRSMLHEAGADEVVVDDLLNPDDLETALTDVDAIISTVGSTLGDIRSADRFVDGAGTRALVDTAVSADVDTFCMESAIGVGTGSASPLATVFNTIIGPIQAAKADAEAAIRKAPFRHVIIQPGVLTNGPRTDTVTVAETDSDANLWGTISRADVARVLLGALVTPAATNKTFEVTSTPQPMASASNTAWQLPAHGNNTDKIPMSVASTS
ncbi:NAD(P)H-binding protein [Haloquadratum walsbyi]|jgi:Predicted nucleoside-diphosphate-sugar epimerases|uniref:Putative nucleoside-diphosphate-sugar epimerase n=1 Tax=Haloquadratum walsbyi J07HQW2 TaxID=1238425 RepID=U1NH02_9EURY|nr:NAD(P)H-binding protein [Haloquadratum walsbyi]ERG96148.1 MAG: putative nucleoside-diphosphate-sugar epimerase [Haloquadratum walsbyi J07HQW2]